MLAQTVLSVDLYRTPFNSGVGDPATTRSLRSFILNTKENEEKEREKGSLGLFRTIRCISTVLGGQSLDFKLLVEHLVRPPADLYCN